MQRPCPSLKTEAVIPTPPRLVKDDVLKHLSSCETFHFAGHGISDLFKPLKSALCISDWRSSPLTVGDIRDLNLRESAPWLAYLSSCSTSQVQAESLVNEMIHPVSACELAGFRHGAVTLWEVSDEYCVKAANALYKDLCHGERTDFEVARALHTALRAIRDRSLVKTLKAANGTSAPRENTSPQGALLDECPGEASDNHVHDNQENPVYRVGTWIRPFTGGSSHWVPYIHFGV